MRLGSVERFRRTFTEKYVTNVGQQKAATAAKKMLDFDVATSVILQGDNFRDDHKTIKEFIPRRTTKGG